MITEELPPATITLCALHIPHGATDPAGHVVLFSLGGEFAGTVYPYGARVVLCLRHGDDVLNARRSGDFRAPDGWVPPEWLRLNMHNLPVPSLGDHAPSARRPTRTGWATPSRPRPGRR